MLTFQDLTYIEGNDWTTIPFGNIPQKCWQPGKDATPDQIIQSTVVKCAPMQVVNQSMGQLQQQGTKMSLLSDELWLITNNSKSFANRGKSIIRNDLGLCKHSEIYLI